MENRMWESGSVWYRECNNCHTLVGHKSKWSCYNAVYYYQSKGCKQCGSTRPDNKLKIQARQHDIECGVYENNNGKWCRSCPECHTTIEYKHRHLCHDAHNNNRGCSKCSRKKSVGSRYYQLRALGQTDQTTKYYVYLLIDPRTHTVFYVGKGQTDRMYSHWRDMLRGKINNGINGKLFRYLKDLHQHCLEPVYEKPLEDLTELDALALEAGFIDFYGLDNICNYQPSGFGCLNHSEEIKQKIRTSLALTRSKSLSKVNHSV